MSDFGDLMERAAAALSADIPAEWDRERPDARVVEVLNLTLRPLVEALSARNKLSVIDAADTALRELSGLESALRGEIRRTAAPDAPEGHRWFVEVPRSHREVFEEMRTGEGQEAARRRLGPRLRCECGRGFGSRPTLDDHHLDPLRDERYAAPER